MHLREPSFYSCCHYFKLVLKSTVLAAEKLTGFFWFEARLIIIVIITIDWFVWPILFSYHATTSHVISTI